MPFPGEKAQSNWQIVLSFGSVSSCSELLFIIVTFVGFRGRMNSSCKTSKLQGPVFSYSNYSNAAYYVARFCFLFCGDVVWMLIGWLAHYLANWLTSSLLNQLIGSCDGRGPAVTRDRHNKISSTVSIIPIKAIMLTILRQLNWLSNQREYPIIG